MLPGRIVHALIGYVLTAYGWFVPADGFMRAGDLVTDHGDAVEPMIYAGIDVQAQRGKRSMCRGFFPDEDSDGFSLSGGELKASGKSRVPIRHETDDDLDGRTPQCLFNGPEGLFFPAPAA